MGRRGHSGWLVAVAIVVFGGGCGGGSSGDHGGDGGAGGGGDGGHGDGGGGGVTCDSGGEECQGGACVDGVCQGIVIQDGLVDPWALAVDDTYIYWTNYTDGAFEMGTVMRMPKAGGDPETLADTLWSPTELVLGDGALYWTSHYGGDLWVLDPIEPGTPDWIVAEPAQLDAFAIDDVNAYVLPNGSLAVRKAPLMLHQDSTILTPLVEGQTPVGVTTDGTWVYWIDIGDKTIKKTSVDGGDAQLVAGDLGSPGQLRYFQGDIYFNTVSTLARVSVDGGEPETLVDDLPNPASHFWVDADGIYWVHVSLGTVYSMRFSDRVPRRIATDLVTPSHITTDETTIYWTVQPPQLDALGSLMKAVK